MKTSNLKSTYELVIESEDKNRSALETLIYALFILSAVFSIWQFAIQPVITPTGIVSATVPACQMERV